jgi:hypothetical protein
MELEVYVKHDKTKSNNTKNTMPIYQQSSLHTMTQTNTSNDLLPKSSDDLHAYYLYKHFNWDK